MKRILVIAVLFCSASHLWADREVYTAQCAEGATLIGVWRSDDVEEDGDNIRLKSPSTVLKGDPSSIGKTKQYSSRLKADAQRIEREGAFILFVRVDGERADLVADSGRLTYNSLTLKAVGLVIEQLELKKKWTNLSVNEQIERSDLIVSGSIPVEGPDGPRDYTISPDKIYHGVLPERLSVLPVPKEQLNVRALFFIQRHVGSGPNHVVMNAIPIKDAEEYLKRLKEKGISQPEN